MFMLIPGIRSRRRRCSLLLLPVLVMMMICKLCLFKNANSKQHHGHHGFFQYARQPAKGHWEFGYRRGNHEHFIERHEHAAQHSFKSKVLWKDNHGGHGEHYIDYNHKGTGEEGPHQHYRPQNYQHHQYNNNNHGHYGGHGYSAAAIDRPVWTRERHNRRILHKYPPVRPRLQQTQHSSDRNTNSSWDPIR